MRSKPNGRIPTPRHRRMQYRLFAIYAFAFVFDFRSITSSGSLPQFVMLSVALAAAAACLWWSRLEPTRAAGRLAPLGWWIGGIVAFSMAVALLRGEPSDEVLRNALPFALCGLSFLVVDGCLRSGCELQPLVRIMYTCALISMGWRCFHGLTFRGVGLAEVRYNIVTPLLPVVLGGAALAFIRPRGRVVAACLALVVALVLWVLSLTRIYAVTFVVLIVATWFCWHKLSARGPAFGAAGKKVMLRLLSLVMIGLLALVVAEQRGVVDVASWSARWSDRVYQRSNLNTREDITLLTREAEASGVIKELFSSPYLPLIGCGVGAGYYWDASYFAEVAPFATREVFDTRYHYPSHNMWLYNLFAFGAIGGGLFSWILIRAVVQGGRVISKGDRHPDDLSSIIVCWLALVCFGTHSLTSSPFGERGAGLYIGLLAAMCYVGSRTFAIDRPERQSGHADEPSSTQLPTHKWPNA